MYELQYPLITNKRTSTGMTDPSFNKWLTNRVPESKLSTGETDHYYAVLKEALQKYNGLGMSANQLGIPARVCLIFTGGTELFLVNPVITFQSKEGFAFYESCLSLPKTLEKPIMTVRATKVKVKTDNLGELTFEVKRGEEKDKVSDETMRTVVVQHEIDHLDGFTILDRQANKPFVKQQSFGRNEKIIMKSPEGEFVEVKMKRANDFYLKGYEVV